MRLFANDEIPALSVSADELPMPWILPRVPRRHRDRLVAMLVRAVRAFDPRIRVVSLRWVERRLIEEGRVLLLRHPLVCWRIESTDPAMEALEKAPGLVRGRHVFDFEDDPGVVSQGWMGPVKVALLHQITNTLLEEIPISSARDAEITSINGVIEIVKCAANVLVSPIDLLDFTERLYELYVAGLPLEEARRDAVAAVLAARFEPAGNEKKAKAVVDAVKQVTSGRVLDEKDRLLLWSAGLAEKDPGTRLPLFDWIAEDNVVSNLEWRVRGSPTVDAWPPSLRRSSPPSAPDSFIPLRHEARAEAMLDRIRSGAADRWSHDELRHATKVLLEFAGEVDQMRGHRHTRALLDRAAALYQAAARLLEADDDHPAAARCLVAATNRLRLAHRLENGSQAANDAVAFSERAPPVLRAQALLARVDLRIRCDQWSSAATDIDMVLAVTGEERSAERGQALWKRALVRTGRREFAAAKEDFEGALRVFDEVNDERSRAELLVDRARLHILDNAFDEAQKDTEKALAFYERATINSTADGSNAPESFVDEIIDFAATPHESLADELTEDESEHAWALTMRGTARLAQGNYRDAATDLEMAIRLFGQAEDDRGRAVALLTRGELRAREKDILGAEADSEMALPILERLADLRRSARAHTRWGLCRIERGDFEGAERDLCDAERLFRAGEHQLGLEWIQIAWAKLRRAQGRLDEALAAAMLAKNALTAPQAPSSEQGRERSPGEVPKSVPVMVDAWEAAEALEELARIHEARGDAEAARDAATQAEALGRTAKNNSAVRAAKDILRKLGGTARNGR